MKSPIDIEQVVNAKYGLAAQQREEALCCPVEYDTRFLDVIPEEIRERDYGCGNPSSFVREGDVVLDLGSGAGKICYIAAQIVGSHGRVIGVDANDEMLALAEKYRLEIGQRLGYLNVEFRKGRIQDLRLDLRLVDSYLASNPVASAADLSSFQSYCTEIKNQQPLIADESIDLVLSNCVLNLVRPQDKEQLFNEMFRVLRRGGRAAISDIVSDEEVPEELQRDTELWSGCIAGAYREDAFLDTFDRAGFHGMEIVKRDEKPWRTIQGIEFRSITVVAHKGKQGPCWEGKQAVIYRGPWRKVVDDDGHVLERGMRMAVCDKTFQLYKREPYGEDIIAVEPREPVSLEMASPFDCKRTAFRHPRETKGSDYTVTEASRASGCEPENGCC
jgi:SAM-dependent methyltransferase